MTKILGILGSSSWMVFKLRIYLSLGVALFSGKAPNYLYSFTSGSCFITYGTQISDSIYCDMLPVLSYATNFNTVLIYILTTLVHIFTY